MGALDVDESPGSREFVEEWKLDFDCRYGHTDFFMEFRLSLLR